MEKTEKYQRSIIKTLVFQAGNQTIQGTYIVDKRTQSVIEVSFEVLESIDISVHIKST